MGQCSGARDPVGIENSKVEELNHGLDSGRKIGNNNSSGVGSSPINSKSRSRKKVKHSTSATGLEAGSGSYFPSSFTDNSIIRPLKAEGGNCGTKLTLLGGLRRERKLRKEIVEIPLQKNLMTSEELRVLLGVEENGEGPI